MKLKPYSDYKNSGTTWLGKIPKQWEVKRLSSLFHERKEKVSDKVYSPLSVTKIGILPQLESAAKTNDGDNRKKVCIDDFVINSRSDRKGSSGLSPHQGSVSLINTVLIPHGMDGRYIHNFFRSFVFQEEFYRVGRGIVADLWSTKYSEMRTIMLPVPSREEQRQIAKFLDWQTTKINKLIQNKKKLIALLREQKQNIINEAITKGIDPHVKMKDSGITWLSSVPAHWDIKRIKNILMNLNVQTDKKLDDEIYIAMENVESWTGRIILPDEEVKFESKVKKFHKNDLLFGKLRPYLAKVARPQNSGVCVGEFLVLRNINNHISPEYLEKKLRSKEIINIINSSTFGAKMPRADWGFIGNVVIAYPSSHIEQQAILLYIEKETALIDKTIARAEQETKLIQEYRTRLIADVVTGKLDVRNINIPDFEPIELIDELEDEKIEAEEIISEDME